MITTTTTQAFRTTMMLDGKKTPITAVVYPPTIIKNRPHTCVRAWTGNRMEEFLSPAQKKRLVEQLEEGAELVPVPITVREDESEYGQMGNWDTAKDLFPTIAVYQEDALVRVVTHSVSNSKRGQWGKTHSCTIEQSKDGQVVTVRGECGLRNDRRHTGGRQKFCFVVFRGDSGHIYTHRAPATKGWMETSPNQMLSRLRKIGLGLDDKDVLQQGDFLLKPCKNGMCLPESEFQHESMGAGHHKFDAPVLFASRDGARHYLIKEETILRHYGEGVRHPDLVVPPGQYRVGTTAQTLRGGEGD